MSKIAIVTDSNSGISQAQAKEMGIYVVPMPFLINGKEYLDGIGFDYESLYEDEYKEMIFTDLDTINEIFAQLHKKYPDKYVFSTAPNLISQGSTVILSVAIFRRSSGSGQQPEGGESV